MSKKKSTYDRERNKTPERREYMKQLRAKPESREKRLAYIKAYNADPKVKAYRKAYNLKQMYGISIQDLTCIALLQGGCCAVCSRPFNDTNKGTKPHVDHDHGTGDIRGLLCGPCNTVEGFIRRLNLTPAEFAQRLQAYLDNPPAQQEVLW